MRKALERSPISTPCYILKLRQKGGGNAFISSLGGKIPAGLKMPMSQAIPKVVAGTTVRIGDNGNRDCHNNLAGTKHFTLNNYACGE